MLVFLNLSAFAQSEFDLTKKIFEKTGYRVLQKENWKKQEIAVLADALNTLPEFFYRLKSHENFIKKNLPISQKSSALSEGKIVTKDFQRQGNIFLSASNFDLNEYDTVEIIIHEMAHQLDSSTQVEDPLNEGYAQKIGFWAISSWKKEQILKVGRIPGLEEEALFVKSPKAKFVSIYAEKNPYEDWAESVASYVRNPALLYYKAPQKYQFMKEKVFQKKEFSGYTLSEEDMLKNELKNAEVFFSCFDKRFSLIKDREPYFEYTRKLLPNEKPDWVIATEVVTSIREVKSPCWKKKAAIVFSKDQLKGRVLLEKRSQDLMDVLLLSQKKKNNLSALIENDPRTKNLSAKAKTRFLGLIRSF